MRDGNRYEPLVIRLQAAYTIWYVLCGLVAFSKPGARAHGVKTAVLKANRSLSDALRFGKPFYVVFKVKINGIHSKGYWRFTGRQWSNHA